MSLGPPMNNVTVKKHSPDSSLPPLIFGEDKTFETALHRRVDEYFSRTGTPRTATAGVYVKAVLIIAFFATTYFLLVFIAATAWQGVLLAIVLGFSMVEIGVNIQHDGAHNSFSGHRFVNRMAAMTVDLVGASSYFWHWKHNRFHHTYTNIAPYDTDINLGILARIAPSGRRLWFHRWQHLYLWPFYGLMVIKWQLFDDFYNAIKGRLGSHEVPRPKKGDLFVFIMGKSVFLSLAFVVPLIFHPFWSVIFFYGLTTIIEGMTLSLIFILPHGVGEAEFPVPEKATGRLPYPRAVHQVRVTVDFMRNNPVVTWLVGGLNYHREHHLFPSISHVHYPRIAGIIDEVCEKSGIRPVNHHSYADGLLAHYHWLRRMGSENPSGIS